MNNKYFRVIFSKVLNCLVVVSELAKSEGKDNKKCGGILQPFFHFLGKLKPVAFCFFCALGFVTFTTHTLAETLIIQADKAAPKNQQPIILHTANGLPQVNIQTPNAQGLSHNKYTKFDVDTKGAILNNSASNVKTQQAGWIQANPYLAKGEAKVILNEVNSHDPSILKGYVEVAGKKADVIIANPSGLHCEGCGIINAHRATFTTGQAQINNGHLEGFVVAKGRVTVSGKGLDNSKIDYTEILAREVQVNAGIWSKKELKVATGKNHIKRTSAEENLQILHTQEENAAENAPHFAIDVGELGGMYAGKIHLIGTENGVGVRNAGHIGASAETLKIDSQGRIVNTGTLNSHQALDLTATKSIENKGKIENRQGDIQLNTKADIKQDGSVVARQGNIHKQAAKAITQQGETVAKGDIRYTASSVDASTSSLIAAGVNVKDSEKGEVRELENQSAQGKSIQITTSNKSTLQGKNIAPNKVQVQATEVNLDHSQNSAHTIEVKASKGKIQANGATIIAKREIKLTTPTLLETQNSHLKAEKLTTKQRSLNTKNATWEQIGKDELVLNVADTLQNSGGTFSTQGDFTVKANGIDNQGGRLLAQGKITIDAAQGKVDSSGGVVYSPKTINILSGELVNNSGLIQSGQNITLNTQGKGLSNNNTLTDNQSKGIVALGTLQIHSANLVNQQGRIVSGGQQQLNISDLNNQQGLIYTQEALSLNSANIKNDKGQIKAAKQADLVISDDLSQQNGVVEADVLNLSAHNIDSRDESQIVANRTTISVENQLVNSNSLIQADKEALTLQAARLDNTKGRMIAKKAQLDLKARVQFNNLQGSVWTNNKLNMNVGKFNNQQGTLHSEQDLNLTATQLENNQGTISSNTNSSLKIKNAMSQEAGHILSSGVLSIHADQLHSTNKSVISGNQVNVATGQMVNKASQLLAKQAMTISSQALDNTQGEISSQHNAVTIDTHQQKLDNTQGKIRSTLALSIQSGELDNSQGAVHSESDILLNTHQQKLINQHTLSAEKGIIALGQLTLQSGVFNNQQGYLASRLDQFLTVSDLNNTQGLIKASQKLKLTAEDIQNHEGLISAKTAANISVANQFMQRNGQLGADELTLNTARLSNEQGSLIAATSANIQIAGQLSNTQSRINTVNDLIIKSQQLNNSLGVINSRDGNIDIHTQQHQLDNTKGHMTAKGNLTLSAGELTNQQGYIQSQQQATIDLGSSALQNQNGTLSTDADLRLTAGTIHNDNGKIVAKQHINADIANLYQHNGTVKAEQQLNLSASGEILSKNHSQLIGENLNIRTNGQLDNQQSEIVAQQSVTLRSAELNNNNGVLIAEQGNLEIDTQQQSLTNQQGKLSAGANLTLNSGLLDNQQGLIQSRQNMMINTHQGNLNNQQTKIDPQRKQNQGIIALGELVLTTQQLLNQQGYLLSKGQQTLNTQSIENGEGVIASLANQNISVSQHIGNVLGRISGNATTIKAQSVDNQSGLLQGEHSLNVKVTETLNNQNGQIKADELLDAKAKIIHNREGQMRAVNGALSLSSQQKLDNRLGNISAKSQAMIKAKGINNQQGLIYNEQGGLELNLQQQALENQQGNVIAKATLNVESGSITNHNGAIYAEHLGTLKVDGVVDNQHNGKIHGLGEMQIQANQIDNRGGEIRTQNKLTLDVATDINNQKVSGMGSFIESGDKLIINAAQINNSQTKSNTEKMHQGILASHLTISAQSLNNQRGKIHSQETSNFVIQQNLDNRQGDVTGSGSVSITGEQSNLNNQDGRLQADTLLVISANEVTTNGHIEGQDVQIRQKQDFVTGQYINADRSLAITTEGNLTNRHHLYADESVTLNAQHISNQVDARISSANTQLNAKGNLTNEGLINSISPEDNAKTVIKVGGTLLNTGKGRIYGDDIALQADRIENSDKDYGNGEIKSAVVAARGRLDLAAREIDNNTAHYLSDNQIGATLFSVGNMTFGRTLNAENRAEGKAEILRNNSSLIESERHIALNVAQVTNSNPHLMVHHLINGKEGDEITRIKGSEKTINQEYIIPYNGQNLPAAFENQKGAEKGSLSAENDTYISMKNLVWVSWSRAGQLVYNLNNVEPTLLKAGDQITEDMLLASRNQMRCDGYESSTSHCHYIPAGQYEIDSPIWAYANATPPTKSSPVFSFDELAAQPWYKEEEWFSVDPKTKELDQFIAPPKPIEPTQPIRGATETDNDFQARTESYQQALVNYHQAKEKWDFYQTKIKPYNDWVTENAEAIEKVDEKILAHNQALRQKLGQAYFRNFWLIKLKQSQEDESKVIQTLPGQILAAGNLTFDGNRLINDRSTVIAGEKLNLIGTVENRDQEGLHRLTESGSSQYTKERWRGGFKRYHQREWGRVNDYKRIIETPFDMHVYRLEDKVNYVQNSRISEEMKEKTPHSLTLTNVGTTTDVLRATANQGLGELNGTLSGDFTELTSSERDISHIDTQDIKGQEVHTTNVKEELTAFQDVRASRLNGLASSGIAPQNEIKAPKTTTTRPLERLVLNDNQEVRSIEPNVVIPQNVLYRVNAEPDSKVLIETDPDFTDKRRWLSSDYMFNALRYEPNATQKRLGDGFYEQRLVREQINRLTGRQFLGNSRDFDSQYKALMDAGISFAQKFNLRPGIALSSAQVAQLTSDIVWFEKQMVTLPDGNQSAVLVPRVYALVKKGDITSNGSLLSGSHVYHQGGEFINSGTVSGRALVQFDSDSIRNTGNISGGTVVGKVRGDVENIGGTIEADRAILLDIAGDFTHRSTTHTTEVNEKGYQRRDTTLGRKGLLYVKGEEGVLQLSANNINLAGAGIINDGKGQTSLSAKSQLNLSALSVGFDEKMGEGNHYRNEKVQGVAISHIQGKGDVVLSGRDIYSEGAEVDAKGRLALLAENEIVLGTASQQREYEEYHKTKKRNVFATSTKESYQQSTAKIEKGSQIQGQSVLLQSKGTTTLVGTNMLATNNLVIKAQQGLLLANAENYLTQHEWEKQKKSGFMLEKSAGSMRIGFGVSRAKDKDNHQSTQVVSSQLQSLTGNINVVSQKGDVSGNAVILDAGKDIYLQGKNIALKAATETQIKEHQSALKSASMGIGMTYKPKATFKQAYGEQEGQGSAGSAVGKLITAGEALDKTSHKVTQQFAPYVSAKASQSTHQEQHNNAVVSQLNAGGKLSLIATEGNLSTEGALLSAKEDGTLWAKQDIDLGVALSTQSQSAKGTRIGFDFDASRRPTDVVGKYLGKEQGEGESEKQHASVLSFGGKGTITAKEGNLTLLGSQVVANDNVSLSAGKNIRLATAVDSIAQGDSNTFHGMGEAVVSETERFSGYNRKLGNQEGKQTTHTGASIASLKSNVDIYAGKDLHQTSAQVLAKNRINISAENVIADTAYNNTSHNSHQSDLKVGMFARVISPIIDLVNSVEKSVKDKEASDRVKAAQLMGLAAQGYNLNHALNHDDKAVLFRAEVGFGVAHSRQRQTGENQESIGNQLNAKEIEIEARNGNLMAMQTDFTARDEKGERIAGSHINLSAKENIELYAGKSHYRQQGKNQSYGTEVGTAFSVGAKTGWSFYAKEGFSKGKQESEGKTYHNSHIDTDTLTLSSGKDTALIGATAKAKTIYADIKGHLHIESQQDEHKQNSKQFGLGTKVEFGFGSAWEFSGNASAEGGKSNSKQVNEQAGLFAEEGGYHISADNVHLKGGVIASTNAKNSELTTNKLTFEDINNSANYGATSGAISGGYSQSGTSVNPSLPMHEQGEDSTTTKATLTEGKITLNKDSQATETTAAALGINTDISQANRQVEQPKDVNQLLKEQKEISANVGHIATAASNFSNQQAKEAEAEKRKAGEELAKAKASGDVAKIDEKQTAYNEASIKAEAWGEGGSNRRKVDATVAVVGAILAGKTTAQAAVAAVSPELNAQIHEITKDSKTANLFAHAALSAAEFYAAGLDPASGALAGVVGEGSAMLLAEKVFNKQPSELTAEEKGLLKAASQLAGAIAGGVAGNSTATAVEGMATAKRAVENNYLSIQLAKEKADIQQRLKNPNLEKTEKEKLENRLTQINQIDVEKDIALEQACANAPLSANCQTLMKEVKNYEFGYFGTSSQSGNYYGMPVYTRNNLLYGEDANKVAAYSKQYDLLTHLKEKNIQDIAKSYNIDSRYLNYIDSGSQIVGNVLSSVAAVKIGKNQTEYPSSGVSTYHREKVGDVDYPEGMTININWKNHLIKGEGVNQKKGIIGAHNKDNFLDTLTKGGGRIVKEENSSVDGIYHVYYEIPRLSRNGTPDGSYKIISSPKTVYDPKKYSDEEMLKMGQEAAAKGYFKSRIKNQRQNSQEINGIKFRYYIDDNGGVTNVHPE